MGLPLSSGMPQDKVIAVGETRKVTLPASTATGAAGGVQQEWTGQEGPLPAELAAASRKKYSELGLRFLISCASLAPV